MISNGNNLSYSKDYSKEEREGEKKTKILRVRINKELGRYIRERLSNLINLYNSFMVKGIKLGRLKS